MKHICGKKFGVIASMTTIRTYTLKKKHTCKHIFSIVPINVTVSTKILVRLSMCATKNKESKGFLVQIYFNVLQNEVNKSNFSFYLKFMRYRIRKKRK